MKRGMWVGKVLIGTLVAMLVVYGVIISTQYLWNWLVPSLFAGPVMSFWQTAGLLLLTKIFFWPFGRCRCQGANHGGPWKYYWKEKWTSMSPEERERIKQKMKEKWCYKESPASDAHSGPANG